MRSYNQNDFNVAVLNNQEIINGTSGGDITSPEGRYWILAVFGAAAGNPVTIKDKDTNTVIIIDSPDSLHAPIYIDGGFTFTAASAVYVQYCKTVH